MKIIFSLLFIISSAFAKIACPDYKAVVCHAGSEINPHFVEVCVSFSSLYGHLAEHANDYYGECSLRNVKQSYVCNAGLRQKDVDDKICIRRDGDATAYVSDCGTSKNCTCTSAKDLFQFDFFAVDLADFDPALAIVTSNYTTKNIQAGKERYKVATADPARTIIASQNGLAFNLGSERMNAEYFVDACWMNTTGMEEYSLEFSVDSRITSNTQGDNSSIDYASASGLQSRFLLYCDTTFDGVFDLNSVSMIESTSYLPFNIGQYAKFEYTVADAEFCFIRQSLIETNPMQMRPWNLKNIVVTNNVTSHEEIPVERPIEICHISEISKHGGNGTNNNYSSMIETVRVGQPFSTNAGNKIYECSNLRFNNSDHLKAYVSFAKDAQDFRDIHQHDYVGTCNNICGPIHGNGAN